MDPSPVLTPLRREQMVLAVATLRASTSPSDSRCTAVLSAVLWLIGRARWTLTIRPFTEADGPCALVQLLDEEGDLASVASIDHSELQAVSQWDHVAQLVVRHAWSAVRDGGAMSAAVEATRAELASLASS